MTRAMLLGTCLILPGCLQPVGFPWSDAGGSTGEPASSTGAATTSTGSTGSTTDAPTTSGSTSTDTSTTDQPSTSTDTSTGSTSSSTGGSTEPGPICGDGQLDPGEDCDDANDVADDGCNLKCGRDRIIFVTSTKYSGDQVKGVKGGDDICRAAAQKAGLANALTFKAWLSDSVTDAIDRIEPRNGRYLRVDGLLVADGFADLLDGELENPIEITELDGVYEAGVWTGTRPDGTRGKGINHCEDWTYSNAFDPNNGGFYGFAQSWDDRWTFEPNEDINPGPCGGELALYCIEG
jgi:cysteine-rich repeat protein